MPIESFEKLPRSARRKARELAMQVMFVWDTQGADDENDVRAFELAGQIVRDGTDKQAVRDEAMRMARDAWSARAAADAQVERLAPKWPPRRQPGVDRNILRLAIWEITTQHAPVKVAIDEAIELARAFSTEQSPAFINGVLDAVYREYQALMKT